jgi:hypothetical protein
MSSAVTNLWRQFVQRRLWPVAIVLIAALAVVPLALTEDPAPAEPAPAVPATTADSGDELATQPIVGPAEARTKRRKVLGDAKNPFGVAKQDATSNSRTDNSVVSVNRTGDDAGSPNQVDSPSTDGGTTPSSGTPVPTTPAAPAPAPKKYAPQELTVRFGGPDDVTRRSVERLQPLPTAELPVLIYMGVLKDGKTAVFLVDHGVTPVGDGECRPSPEDCETIRLREGETEFLDVKDDTGAVVGQYQLDLIKIHNAGQGSASASKAKKSRAASRSTAGRSELRSVVGRTSAFLP